MSSQSDIITKLKSPQTKQILNSLSIKHLWIFGSRAKNNELDTSDLDLLYEIDDSVDQSGFAFFGAVATIKEIVGVPVDLVSAKHIHPDIEQEILSTRLALW